MASVHKFSTTCNHSDQRRCATGTTLVSGTDSGLQMCCLTLNLFTMNYFEVGPAPLEGLWFRAAADQLFIQGGKMRCLPYARSLLTGLHHVFSGWRPVKSLARHREMKNLGVLGSTASKRKYDHLKIRFSLYDSQVFYIFSCLSRPLGVITYSCPTSHLHQLPQQLHSNASRQG